LLQVNRKMTKNNRPVSNRHGPFSCNIPISQKQHFRQGFIPDGSGQAIRENRFSIRNFSDPLVNGQ